MSLRPACQTSLTSFRLHLHHTESFSLEVHFILSTQASREHHSFQDTQTIRWEISQHTHLSMRLVPAARSGQITFHPLIWIHRQNRKTTWNSRCASLRSPQLSWKGSPGFIATILKNCQITNRDHVTTSNTDQWESENATMENSVRNYYLKLGLYQKL